MQHPPSNGYVSPPTREELFLANLDAAIEFHRTNQIDPHGVGNAVMVALHETRNAYAKAFKLPLSK